MKTCFWNYRGVFESLAFRGSQKVVFGKKRKRKPEFKGKEIINAAWLSEIPNVLSQKFSLKVDRCALLECELLFPISLSVSEPSLVPHPPSPLFLFIRTLSTAFRFFFFSSLLSHLHILFKKTCF